VAAGGRAIGLARDPADAAERDLMAVQALLGHATVAPIENYMADLAVLNSAIPMSTGRTRARPGRRRPCSGRR
jgi:hypothetical protein